MRPLLTLVIAISLLTLLSCNNDQIGGSSAPDFDVSGGWSGTLTPDVVTVDNKVKYLQVVLENQGSTPDDGSVVGETKFCETSANFCVLVDFQDTCPEQRQNWASTIENSDMVADLRGVRREFIEMQIEWSDPDNAVGRYEYVEVGEGGVCLGETGEIVMRRRNT